MLFALQKDDARNEQTIFTMNARHTRFGVKIGAPEMAPGVKLHGMVEIDFAGGFPNSSTAARQPIPRLRHAWVEVDKDNWELRIGQDWALISGPFPTTTDFVVGAGKGNLWMRYPQVKFTMKMDAMKFAISLNRPMAGNIKYDEYLEGDFDFVGDGERTALPWVMGRVWFMMGDVTFSMSGHYGQERIAAATVGGIDYKTTYLTTYSANADIIYKMSNITFTARGFYGENLNSFFGGVFQGYARDAVNVKVENIVSMGGWANLRYAFTKKWAAVVGYGMDDPDDEFLGNLSRDKNEWIWGNIAYTPYKPLTFMLGVDYMKTTYFTTDGSENAPDNIRVQMNTVFKF